MKKEYHFEFEVLIADFEAFNVFVTKQAYKKGRLYRIAIGCALMLIGFFNFYISDFTFKTDFVALFVVGFIWVFFIPMLTQRSVKKRARTLVKNARPGALIGFRDMLISSEHIWYKSELYDNKLKWGVIQKVEQMPQHVLLFLADTSALIIPMAVIGDTNAVSEFVDFANQQIDKSQNKDEIASHLVG